MPQFPEFRNLDLNPYTPDEQRVVDYINHITDNQIGAGDDPIGFILASHANLVRINKMLRKDNLLP